MALPAAIIPLLHLAAGLGGRMLAGRALPALLTRLGPRAIPFLRKARIVSQATEAEGPLNLGGLGNVLADVLGFGGAGLALSKAAGEEFDPSVELPALAAGAAGGTLARGLAAGAGRFASGGLSGTLPTKVASQIPPGVQSFLKDQGLNVADLAGFVVADNQVRRIAEQGGKDQSLQQDEAIQQVLEIIKSGRNNINSDNEEALVAIKEQEAMADTLEAMGIDLSQLGKIGVL